MAFLLEERVLRNDISETVLEKKERLQSILLGHDPL
jgi:hypothetical protein